MSHPNLTHAQLALLTTLISDFDPHLIDIYDIYDCKGAAQQGAARQLVAQGLMMFLPNTHEERVGFTPHGFSLAHLGDSNLRRAMEQSAYNDAQLRQGDALLIIGWDQFTRKYLVTVTVNKPTAKMGFEVVQLEFAPSVAEAIYYLREWGYHASVDHAWEPTQRRRDPRQEVSA